MDVFGVDKNGFIITEVSYDNITPQFRPIVDNILNAIIKEFSAQLESVYLYGSIATGKSVAGKSDFDSVLVFKNKPNELVLEKILNLAAQLSIEYELVLRGVDLEYTDIADVYSEKEKYGGMCFMKHLCICMYGNDIAKDVLPFKPTDKVAQGFNGDISQKLEIWRTKLDKAITDEEVKKLSESVAKKIIRTGFSLVMPRARSWTADLQISYDTFIKFYPEKALEMKTALDWSKSGLFDKRAVSNFIDTFGEWLSIEFQRVIPKI